MGGKVSVKVFVEWLEYRYLKVLQIKLSLQTIINIYICILFYIILILIR